MRTFRDDLILKKAFNRSQVKPAELRHRLWSLKSRILAFKIPSRGGGAPRCLGELSI